MSYLLPVEYLPHDAPMLLLESVESVTDESAVCHVAVSSKGVLAPFLNSDGANRGRLVRLASPSAGTEQHFVGNGAGRA